MSVGRSGGPARVTGTGDRTSNPVHPCHAGPKDRVFFQKRVSVKRSYGRVTGVGHTSLSSASIRSGEIIIPS